MTKSDTGYWNGTWGAGNSNELLSCKNQHLWYEHNTIGVATLWTGAHRFDSVSSLYGKFVRFQTSFVSGDLKTKTIHNRVWYFWWEWYTNLFYLDVDHKRFYFGVCLVVLLHWFRADSYFCDGRKSWTYFFRLPFLWDHLTAMSCSLFLG